MKILRKANRITSDIEQKVLEFVRENQVDDIVPGDKQLTKAGTESNGIGDVVTGVKSTRQVCSYMYIHMA